MAETPLDARPNIFNRIVNKAVDIKTRIRGQDRKTKTENVSGKNEKSPPTAEQRQKMKEGVRGIREKFIQNSFKDRPDLKAKFEAHAKVIKNMPDGMGKKMKAFFSDQERFGAAVGARIDKAGQDIWKVASPVLKVASFVYPPLGAEIGTKVLATDAEMVLKNIGRKVDSVGWKFRGNTEAFVAGSLPGQIGQKFVDIPGNFVDRVFGRIASGTLDRFTSDFYRKPPVAPMKV